MDAYVARQPILDKKKKIYAYELLFRDGTANYVPDIDGDTATSTLLSNSFFTIGMETVIGGRKAFINFTENLIVRGIPLLLPQDKVVVEILEDVKPVDSVIEACRQLSQKGYQLALDDFDYHPEYQPLIDLADIIKFDFRLTPLDQIETYLQKLPGNGIRYLAEKVETYEEFQIAKEMGFELFQGYFFHKPEIVHGKKVQGSQIQLLQIMSEINKPEFDFKELDNLISRDVTISYKLLKYINSAFFATANRISSIRQALVYLGEKEIRRFISLVAMTELATDKPSELIRSCCIRGKFCELVGSAQGASGDASELFTLGMFSLIDAILDQPMDQIMDQLPLNQNLRTALAKRTGPLVPFLLLAESYERGDWVAVTECAAQIEVTEKELPPLYTQACQWANMVDRL
jgi:c-di-GMP-related signal transduction protein